jgi:hypothetical protein
MIKWAINFIGRISVPIRRLPIIAVLIVTAIIILVPTGGVPYIEINSGLFTFDLPVFQNCEVAFQDAVDIKDYGVGFIPSASTNTSPEVHLMPVVVNAKVSRLLIRNPVANQPKSGATANAFKILIEPSSPTAIRISGVTVDGTRVSLSKFADNNLKIHNFQLVRFHYIRRYLAGWIFKFNDVVSNWVLTALSVGLVILVCKVSDMEIQTYIYSDAALKKKLNKLLAIKRGAMLVDRRKAFDRFIAGWHKWDSRFRFLQALGPAIGFILTVSSLVEVLHSPSRSANDLDTFLTGIHVAMISTFLGLFLRLIALEGGRVNDALLDRADMLIDAEEPDTESAATLPVS